MSTITSSCANAVSCAQDEDDLGLRNNLRPDWDSDELPELDQPPGHQQVRLVTKHCMDTCQHDSLVQCLQCVTALQERVDSSNALHPAVGACTCIST